ncbi:hypothetical protein LQV05_003169 [Cryptococcus neoformans]|nr:hypothetical protein LQV05_003169 [Cryptococcus neoformans]
MAPQQRKPAEMAEEKKKALHQYNDDHGHFSLVRNFRLADLITIMNGVCGTLSILSSARYLLLSANLPGPPRPRRPPHPLLCPPPPHPRLRLRRPRRQDLVSFGVAPAVLAFTLGLRTPLDLVALLLFVSCGLARLARFNATVALIPSDPSGKSKYFEGLPIPSSLALTSVMAWWVKQGWYAHGSARGLGGRGVGNDVPFGMVTLWGEKGGCGEVHVVSALFALWGAMMVSKTLRIPKL